MKQLLTRALTTAAFLAVAPLGATAQSAARREPLKRSDPATPAPYRCATVPTPSAPISAQRTQARDLARRGQQSAILGDRASARDQLRQAAALDPTDADLAYQLARANDAADDATGAVREYCRFLAIAPNAPEAAETRERVATLGRPLQLATSQPAVAALQAGISAYERGDLATAETQFRTAIARQPSWAEAYYDRGVVLLARGDRPHALADFEQYLRLKPEADDRVAVVARVNSLRTRTLSPNTALSLGLVIPGAGQFYTGRPVGGVFALAGTGAALAYAFTSSTRLVTEQRQGTDPFGKPYTFSETHSVTERPHMALGLAGAGAIAIGSAIEAYLHVAATATPPRRVSVSLIPGADVLALRATIR
jgi:tetratricopeptide (TPR) repeat protein